MTGSSGGFPLIARRQMGRPRMLIDIRAHFAKRLRKSRRLLYEHGVAGDEAARRSFAGCRSWRPYSMQRSLRFRQLFHHQRRDIGLADVRSGPRDKKSLCHASRLLPIGGGHVPPERREHAAVAADRCAGGSGQHVAGDGGGGSRAEGGLTVVGQQRASRRQTDVRLRIDVAGKRQWSAGCPAPSSGADAQAGCRGWASAR